MTAQPNIISFEDARTERTNELLKAFCEHVERMARDVMASVSYAPVIVGSPEWEAAVLETYGHLSGVLAAVDKLKTKLGANS